MRFPVASAFLPCLCAVFSVHADAATPAIIAHRGGAMLWPENSLVAFRNAEKAGADYLEFDLQMTADNQLLVTHDADINPEFCSAPEGSGLIPKPVRVLTLEQSRLFDCGARSRSTYPNAQKVAGTHMPTLEEVLAAFKDDKNLRFFIETKLPKEGAPGKPIDTTLFAAKFEQLVHKYGLENRVVLQSFDWRTIDAMHELNPAIRTCPLGVPRNSSDYLATLREHHATCIVLDFKETTPRQIRQLQQAGIMVFSGVIDKQSDWNEAKDFGFDAIFTNDPVSAVKFLNGK